MHLTLAGTVVRPALRFMNSSFELSFSWVSAMLWLPQQCRAGNRPAQCKPQSRQVMKRMMKFKKHAWMLLQCELKAAHTRSLRKHHPLTKTAQGTLHGTSAPESSVKLPDNHLMCQAHDLVLARKHKPQTVRTWPTIASVT